MNNQVREFNLVRSDEKKGDVAEEQEEKTIYPEVADASYITIDLIKRLRKSPDVKR